MQQETHDFQPSFGGNTIPRSGGWASMMRLPKCCDAAGLDVAYGGAPLDICKSHRPGARFGPRQIDLRGNGRQHCRAGLETLCFLPGDTHR